MLSPKQTKFHVLRTYVLLRLSPAIICRRKHTSSVIKCGRLRGSVKDVLHCKNLFKMPTKELLALAEAVFGGLNNLRAFKAMITESQSHFQRSERQERVKRCIEVLPLAPRTLKSTKDGTDHRGLNFAGGSELTKR